MADMEQKLLALGQRIKAVRIERGMSQAEGECRASSYQRH